MPFPIRTDVAASHEPSALHTKIRVTRAAGEGHGGKGIVIVIAAARRCLEPFPVVILRLGIRHTRPCASLMRNAGSRATLLRKWLWLPLWFYTKVERR